MKLKNIFFIPLVIILFGVIFTLYLQGKIVPGVYFSGDGGLKALLAKQLATDELRFDLITPTASWIHDLWHQGLYPYEPPFVYNMVSPRVFVCDRSIYWNGYCCCLAVFYSRIC